MKLVTPPMSTPIARARVRLPSLGRAGSPQHMVGVWP